MEDVFRALPVEEREQLRAAMSYPEDSVGALMDFDLVTIRENVTLEVVLRYLRRLEELPDHTDQIFVVDRGEVLKGVLPVHALLVNDPDRLVADRDEARTCSRSRPDKRCRSRSGVRALRPGDCAGGGRRGRLAGRSASMQCWTTFGRRRRTSA